MRARRTPDSRRRMLSKALGWAAAGGAMPPLARAQAAVSSLADEPPEPFSRLHVDNADRLVGITARGVAWRIRDRDWQRAGAGFDPDTPLASGHGVTVGRGRDGGIRELDPGPGEPSGRVQLASHAGMQVLPAGIIAVAREADGRHVAIRLERDGRGSWHETARGRDPVLPDARPVQFDPDGIDSDRDGHIAILGHPTSERYRHAVLGDDIEATALLYLERHSLAVIGRLDLPMPHVFEDIAPRPIAWHGRRALLTIRSGPLGAQLAVATTAAPSPHELALTALGAPIGTRNRWLAPTTDGSRILAVHTPHIGGVLHRYSVAGETLVGDVVARGVTNHAMGSRTLDDSVWLGRHLTVPTQDRNAVRVFTLDAAGTVVSHRDLPTDAPVTSLHRWRRSGTWEIAALLRDGRVATIPVPANPSAATPGDTRR